jgi:3-methyl-2-oxobutanoate hydroxymethyltransferase
MAETILKITKVGVPVVGHIGLTPQRVSSLGGFKAQGRTLDKAKLLLQDALALQEAGCFAIVLEAVPQAVSAHITDMLKIPTIGIGSGSNCSGQVLVQLDALGVYDKFVPKFSKIFGNIGAMSMDAVKEYVRQVHEREFPENGVHTYKMMKGEQDLFLEWVSKCKVDAQTNKNE